MDSGSRDRHQHACLRDDVAQLGARRANNGALDQDRVTGAQQRGDARALRPLGLPARTAELVPVGALDEREVPAWHRKESGHVDAIRRSGNRAAARNREDAREVDPQPHRRGLVLLAGIVLMLVPMLRVVPIVERPETVLGDLLRQEVEVLSRWPV